MKFAGSQSDRKVKAEAEEKKIAEQLKSTKIRGRRFYISNSHLLMKLLVRSFYSLPAKIMTKTEALSRMNDHGTSWAAE